MFGPLKWVEPGRVIPVLGRLSQKEDLQLVASLGYIARFCLIKKKRHKQKQTMTLIDGYSLAFPEEARARRRSFPPDHKTGPACNQDLASITPVPLVWLPGSHPDPHTITYTRAQVGGQALNHCPFQDSEVSPRQEA